MQKLKSLEISVLEWQRLRSQMLCRLFEKTKRTPALAFWGLILQSVCVLLAFFSTWIFTAGLDELFLCVLPNLSALFADVCLKYILFSWRWFLLTTQRWYYDISLLRPNQQTIILGTLVLYRVFSGNPE